ncbi:MAG: YraN family protein [Halopseudomonas aestusnigri]
MKKKGHADAKRVKAQRKGIYAEQMASWFLRLKGYQILASNFKTKVGEIDLVARKGTTLCFIEVKKRATKAEAAEAISSRQKARIIRASEQFIGHRSRYLSFDKRFDAVLIGATVIPYHIKNAWQDD